MPTHTRSALLRSSAGSPSAFGASLLFLANVRELAGAIEAAANLAEQGEILPRHLNIPLRARPTGAGPIDEAAMLPLAEVERAHILRVYDATGRNKTQAAKILGIGLQTLHRKLKAYRVP